MRDKILAVLKSEMVLEDKVDVLEAMMRVTCEKYKVWAIERDCLIIDSLGLQGFADDVLGLLPTDVWERFVYDTENKK